MPAFTRFRTHPPALAMMLIVLMLTSAGPAAAQHAATPASPIPAAATPAAPAQLKAMRPDMYDVARTALAQASARYTIDADITLPASSDDQPEIHGSLAMVYTNTTGAPVEALPFRLYGNGPDPDGDRQLVDSVTRDGAAVAPAWSDDRSTFTVALPTPLAPGEQTTITMNFVTTVPIDSHAFYGMLNVDPERGTWALAHWYPILAGRAPDEGWMLASPSEFGDPIFSTTASYDVTLRTPGQLQVISTGVTLAATRSGGVTESHIVTGPARDITIVLDDDFKKAEREVDGTTITAWYNPGEAEAGKAVLDYASQALGYFNDVIGPYPYATLDVVPVSLFGAAGVELPELIYIGADFYAPGRELPIPNYLDVTVAHEIAHQWWYGLVGNNQYEHAFMDEGLTSMMSTRLYLDAVYGPDVANIVVNSDFVKPFEAGIRAGDDVVVDTPTDDFPSLGDYSFAAYTKAPLGFLAMYQEIGGDAFERAVHQYYVDYRFAVATPDDLLNAFEDASGEELDALWHHWFEEAAGEEDVSAGD